ncbi:hypothetical protein [Microbacterium sp. LWO12-1.2]|uniref:hypothetical protein n=1 Tax=Microbacterium sp. LWO12-1.2 TaxID=3135261 RepID=UPI00341C0FF8
MSDPVAAVWAPLAVGLCLFVLAEVVRVWWTSISARRARRRQIISLMGRAVALQSRAIDDGKFDRAYMAESERPLARVRARYDDLTAQALDLFEEGEEVVAFWTAAEFYGGWFSPLEALQAQGTPRSKNKQNLRLVATSDLARAWAPARPEELSEWARVQWPWDRGNRRGPRYATNGTPGDQTRHTVVVPNSDVNADMLRPFILYLKDGASPFDAPSARETRRLDEKYTSENEAYWSMRESMLRMHR